MGWSMVLLGGLNGARQVKDLGGKVGSVAATASVFVDGIARTVNSTIDELETGRLQQLKEISNQAPYRYI